MAHAQKSDFVFRRNGRVHLNRQGRQCSRLLAAEVCASVVVMLDTPCSEVAWRVLATHSSLQFPLHFPSRASPCAITFQLDSMWSHSDIPHLVGLLWTRDRPLRRHLYLAKHNTQKRQTSLSPVWFELVVSADLSLRRRGHRNRLTLCYEIHCLLNP